jgi:hypothetical protein
VPATRTGPSPNGADYSMDQQVEDLRTAHGPAGIPDRGVAVATRGPALSWCRGKGVNRYQGGKHARSAIRPRLPRRSTGELRAVLRPGDRRAGGRRPRAPRRASSGRAGPGRGLRHRGRRAARGAGSRRRRNRGRTGRQSRHVGRRTLRRAAGDVHRLAHGPGRGHAAPGRIVRRGPLPDGPGVHAGQACGAARDAARPGARRPPGPQPARAHAAGLRRPGRGS